MSEASGTGESCRLPQKNAECIAGDANDAGCSGSSNRRGEQVRTAPASYEPHFLLLLGSKVRSTGNL